MRYETWEDYNERAQRRADRRRARQARIESQARRRIEREDGE